LGAAKTKSYDRAKLKVSVSAVSKLRPIAVNAQPSLGFADGETFPAARVFLNFLDGS
jgi:hypothetical protein